MWWLIKVIEWLANTKMSTGTQISNEKCGKISDEKRKLCADSALRCYGTAYVFEKRAKPIGLALRLLTFTGIAVPAAVGTIVATFNLKPESLATPLWIAGVIGSIQFIVSIWSLVASWDWNRAYYIESKTDNYRMADDYENLMRTTSLSPQEFETELKVLQTQGMLRAQLDYRFDITDKEKRMLMRAGLRKYQRECVGCHQIPKSLKATKCEICGNF